MDLKSIPQKKKLVKTGMASKENWEEESQLHVELSCPLFPSLSGLSSSPQGQRSWKCGQEGIHAILRLQKGLVGKNDKMERVQMPLILLKDWKEVTLKLGCGCTRLR